MNYLIRRLRSIRPALVFFLFALMVIIHPRAVFAGDAILTWLPSATSNVAGYKVYYGTASRTYGVTVDVANQTTFTVTGLAAGTYYFAVTAYDSTGLESGYSNEGSKTVASVDTTPPNISSVGVSGITSSGAAIAWTTDEGSTTQVEYGPSTMYGGSTTKDTTPVTSHSQTLSGLSANTYYHYRVKSADASGNLSVSGDYTFTTLYATVATPTPTAATGSTQTPTSATGSTATSTPIANATWTSTPQRNSGPSLDVPGFTASAGNRKIKLDWTNPSSADYEGVRIVYRTDRYPANTNDGTVLADVTGALNEPMTYDHTNVETGVTYHYTAYSYDSYGDYSGGVQASATADSSIAPSALDSQQLNSGGGCGMISPRGGKPRGPGQAADMTAILAVFLIASLRKVVRSGRIAFRTVNIHAARSFVMLFVSVSLISLFACGGGGSDGAGTIAPTGGPIGNGPGVASLSWQAPMTNSDGSQLTDLAGYKVYYGTSSGRYNRPINIGNQTSYDVTGLNTGVTYYFTVTAYDSSGNESNFSNEGSKTA